MCTALVALSLVPLIGWAGQVSLARVGFRRHRRRRVHAARRSRRQRLRGDHRLVGRGSGRRPARAARDAGCKASTSRWRPWRSPRWSSSCSSCSRLRSARRAARPAASTSSALHFDRHADLSVAGHGGVRARRDRRSSRSGADRSVGGSIALRDSEAAAATVGVNILETKVAVFMLSAGDGRLRGRVPRAVLRDDQRRPSSRCSVGFRIVLALVIGGVGTVAGALFAGVFGLSAHHPPGQRGT